MIGFDERETCYLEECRHVAACHESHWETRESDGHALLSFGACQVDGCPCNEYERNPWAGSLTQRPRIPKSAAGSLEDHLKSKLSSDWHTRLPRTQVDAIANLIDSVEQVVRANPDPVRGSAYVYFVLRANWKACVEALGGKVT